MIARTIIVSGENLITVLNGVLNMIEKKNEFSGGERKRRLERGNDDDAHIPYKLAPNTICVNHDDP